MSSNPIILITGANTGLGFETVKSLCKSSKPYTIIVSGRSIDKANAAIKEAQAELPATTSALSTIRIDLEDDDSISQAFNYVSEKYGRLDILINNGGAQLEREFFTGKMGMRQMWNKTWNVNTTGTHILTHTFAPLLLQSSDPRLIFITSGVSTLAESENQNIAVNRAPAKGWPKEGFSLASYRSSKTGLNMVMREWARILKEDGVKVWAVSPGFLATGLGGSAAEMKAMGAEDPGLGADFVKEVVEGARDPDQGKVVSRAGVQPW